ncbi:LPXTG cell wall anchor domain-containing protein [Agromyces sp. Soil535]|uniref:LPXTG cell wall anchor domain-containing protein n=1 Tax=Agromyces sp. Soil535 TaxID=1736390 RepID=UPI0009E7D026|nr:LPXTG cell wall anchor domain-containing protein [Agromyces sp. Soil535]
MPRSNLPVNAISRTRSRWRALLTTIAVALLAGAGLAAAAPAAAKALPDPWVEVSVGCSTGDDGAGVLQLFGLFEGYGYAWTVTGQGYSVGGSFVASGAETEIAIEGLAPGVYSTSAEVEGLDPVLGEFTVEACAPELGVAVTPLACSTDRNGEALLTLTGLVPGDFYVYDVQGPNFSAGGQLDEVGETEDIELVGLPPGNYYAYAEHLRGPEGPGQAAAPAPPVYDWVGFAIEPCQPAIAVDATECTSAVGTGAVHVALSSLVDGVEYLVWVTDQGVIDGTPYGEVQTVTGDPTGTAELDLSSLPGGRAYTVWVEGVWQAIPPWEEPPFVGSGNFTPLETVMLSVSADFALAACPAAPVKPASTTTLPATGVDGVGPLVLSGLLLLGLGGATLVAARRREAGSRDVS